MSNQPILPVEQEIVNTVKTIFKDRGFTYGRKYSTVLRKNGEPTGKRTHKFYIVSHKGNGYGPSRPSHSAILKRALVDECNAAIYFIDPNYALFYSNDYSSASLTIRPITK